MKSSRPRVWLVTGCSTGLGRVLCEELLARGERVAATARQLESIAALAGDDCLTAALDVTSPATIRSAVQATMERFGRIDVLVNNAGYGEIGAIEDFSDERARRQFDTNVFGVLNVQREVLPILREQRAGHVLNISSIAGLVSYPLVGMYCASKHALEAISEALAAELEPFGVRVTLIEPGRFRTDFAGRSLGLPSETAPAYAQAMREYAERRAQIDGRQPGDPRKAARAMIRVVESEAPPLRLLLGPDAHEMAQAKLERLRADFEAWKDVTLATDLEE